MYAFVVNQMVEGVVRAELDKGYLALPPHLRVGVGNRGASYKKWLEDKFAEGGDFAHMLAGLNYQANHDGRMVILVDDSRIWQAEAFRDFMCENQVSLNAIFGFTQQPNPNAQPDLASMGFGNHNSKVSPAVMQRIQEQLALHGSDLERIYIGDLLDSPTNVSSDDVIDVKPEDIKVID